MKRPDDYDDRVALFWSKVDKTGDCWLWTGSVDQDGYGITSLIPGEQRAHRAAFTIENGPIADGIFICHGPCDAPACVRHIYAGTAHTNLLDARARDRLNPRKGEDHPSRFHSHPVYVPERLRGSGVAFAEARLAAGLTQHELSQKTDLDLSTISRIERGKVGPSMRTALAWCKACGFWMDPSNGLPVPAPTSQASPQT